MAQHGLQPAKSQQSLKVFLPHALCCAASQFLRPEHLEVAPDFAADAALLLAQKELTKINMYKVVRCANVPMCL